MNVLIIDGHNFLHRSRAGFRGGENDIVYNFFRCLRAEVERHKSNRVCFVLEGRPRQLDLLPEYKANRDPSLKTEKERAVLEHFHKQCNVIIPILKEYFPISVMRHPNFECDDVIFNIINNGSKAVNWTVCSNDTDFIQLTQDFENVKVYSPHTKQYVIPPDYDYVTWKALKGDQCDNVPGIPGIGEKRAEALSLDPDALKEFFNNVDIAKQFSRNYNLIKLQKWTNEESLLMTSSTPTCDWNAVKAKFEEFGFNSIVKEPYWTDKFVSTFEGLTTCISN